MTSKPRRLPEPFLFHCDEMNRAVKELNFNCGPTALAVILGMNPFDIPAHLPDFAAKGYTNTTMMLNALRSLGVPFHYRDKLSCHNHSLTDYGLCRIQFEGPWYGKFAYHHTHWVAAAIFGERLEVWDVNQDGNGWKPYLYWKDKTVPSLTKDIRRATGAWHCTHRLELDL